MKADHSILQELLKAHSYVHLQHHKQGQILDTVAEHLKIPINDRDILENLMKDQECFMKIQKCLEIQQEIGIRVMEMDQRRHHKEGNSQTIEAVNKKITRAALARRHEKNQEEMRKDQIFVRLVPKSQSCIQFMLCNRNFPRMEVKLSCNQHLEYLVNYLTNKWIRGKVGFKVILFPDSSFLKALPLTEKEKSLKEPFNNFLMFTDIMTCCGVNQNGVLNMTYEIVETKKSHHKNPVQSTTENIKEYSKNEKCSQGVAQLKPSLHSSHLIQSNRGKSSNELHSLMGDKSFKPEQKHESFPMKMNSPVKYSYRDEFMPESSLFNKNSNFFANNEESMFGSLGFNFNFGVKKDDPLFSFNSNHFFDSYFPDGKKSKEEKGKDIKDHKIKVEEEQVQEKQQRSEEIVSQKMVKRQSEDERVNSKTPPKDQSVVKEEKEDVDQSPEKSRNNYIQKDYSHNSEKQNSKEKENIGEKISKEDPDKKLGTLMSLLDQIEKEKDPKGQVQLGAIVAPPDENNSNKFKEVKTVSIVKKRAPNT